MHRQAMAQVSPYKGPVSQDQAPGWVQEICTIVALESQSDCNIWQDVRLQSPIDNGVAASAMFSYQGKHGAGEGLACKIFVQLCNDSDDGRKLVDHSIHFHPEAL